MDLSKSFDCRHSGSVRSSSDAAASKSLKPCIVPSSLPLGPFSLEPFGLPTSVSVSVRASLAARNSRRTHLDSAVLTNFAPWGLLAGVVAAHVMYLFAYLPEELTGSLAALMVWDGQVSTGGLPGASSPRPLFRHRRLSFSLRRRALGR